MKRPIMLFLGCTLALMMGVTPPAMAHPLSAEPKGESWNLAFNRPVQASGYDKGFMPEYAVDGLYDPYITPPQCWRMSDPGENWIEVAFPAEATLRRIELLLGQGSPGLRFEAWARLPNGKLESLGAFEGKVDGNGLVSVDLSEPRSGITGVRLDMLDPGFPCIQEFGAIGILAEEPPVGVTPACLSAPDLIYHHANVITMNPEQPTAEAVAIKQGRIWAVGSNVEIEALRRVGTTLAGEACTESIDTGGRTIVPGFIDSHQHRVGGLGWAGYNDPEQVIQLAIEQGWTSAHEFWVDSQTLEDLQGLDEAGKLRMRFSAYLGVNGPDDTWYQDLLPGTEYSPYLRLVGIKIKLDHGWGHGSLVFTPAQIKQMVTQAHDLGWQVAAHTVGESAHTAILDAFEEAQGGVADDRYRHRIEHVVVISDEDVERMRRLGVIASIQLNGPGVWVDNADFGPPVFTDDLIPHFARWRYLHEEKVFVIGNSDWHAATPLIQDDYGSPMLLLYQAVTRTGTNGRPPEPWMLAQTITIEQALRSLTINGAYASFEEDVKGSIEVDKLADMVILAANPLTAPIEAVPDIPIIMTMIGGKVEHCASGHTPICPAPFTGVWKGTDTDGSQIIMVLTQTSEGLTGTFEDEYSYPIPPPGYQGSGSGVVLTNETAEMTFDLTRSDGNRVQAEFSLTLSDGNNRLTLGCDAGCPLNLERQ
jgi:hypothetical protein